MKGNFVPLIKIWPFRKKSKVRYYQKHGGRNVWLQHGEMISASHVLAY